MQSSREFVNNREQSAETGPKAEWDRIIKPERISNGKCYCFGRSLV